MALTSRALNAACDAIAGSVSDVSLHTGDPGSGGSSELSGGNYARQTGAYGSASDGKADLDGSVTFGGMKDETISHYGLWDGSSFLGGGELSDSVTFSSDDDTYELTAAQIKVS